MNLEPPLPDSNLKELHGNFRNLLHFDVVVLASSLHGLIRNVS